MAIVNLGYLANAWVYLMDKYVHFTLFFNLVV
jgi:CTP:phosphocholine cytidylyltransferase-like protein